MSFQRGESPFYCHVSARASAHVHGTYSRASPIPIEWLASALQVPTRELGIDASVGFPVLEVTSSEPDGSYGVGSEISIYVR